MTEYEAQIQVTKLVTEYLKENTCKHMSELGNTIDEIAMPYAQFSSDEGNEEPGYAVIEYISGNYPEEFNRDVKLWQEYVKLVFDNMEVIMKTENRLEEFLAHPDVINFTSFINTGEV